MEYKIIVDVKQIINKKLLSLYSPLLPQLEELENSFWEQSRDEILK